MKNIRHTFELHWPKSQHIFYCIFMTITILAAIFHVFFQPFSHWYLYKFYVKYCMKSYIYGMYTIHGRNLVPIERDSLVAQLVRMCLQCWRPVLDPWVGKIPWRRQQLPTPVFWPGEFHGLFSPCICKELDTTERLSLSLSDPLWINCYCYH